MTNTTSTQFKARWVHPIIEGLRTALTHMEYDEYPDREAMAQIEQAIAYFEAMNVPVNTEQ